MAHTYVATAGYSKRVVPAGVPFEFALAENDAVIASPAWRNAPPSRHVLVDSPIEPRSASDLVADVRARAGAPSEPSVRRSLVVAATSRNYRQAQSS